MPAYSKAFKASLDDLDSALAELSRELHRNTEVHAVDSWRADAYDPAWDAPDTAPVRRHQIELAPGVWVYPEYLDRLTGRAPRPGAWQIKEEEYDDLGLEDWA